MSCALPARIVDAVADAYSVSVDEMKSRTRRRRVLHARRAAMHLLREFVEMSCNELGEVFNRDHTTCLVQLRQDPGEDARYQAARRKAQELTDEHLDGGSKL